MYKSEWKGGEKMILKNKNNGKGKFLKVKKKIYKSKIKSERNNTKFLLIVFINICFIFLLTGYSFAKDYPEIKKFLANNEPIQLHIQPNNKVKFEWETMNATSALITCRCTSVPHELPGSVPVSGEKSAIFSKEDTCYIMLYAYGSDNNHTQKTIIIKVYYTPVIKTFIAKPQKIRRKKEFELIWDIEHFKSVQNAHLDGTQGGPKQITKSFGNINLTANNSNTFCLTVIGKNQKIISEKAKIEVFDPPEIKIFKIKSPKSINYTNNNSPLIIKKGDTVKFEYLFEGDVERAELLKVRGFYKNVDVPQKNNYGNVSIIPEGSAYFKLKAYNGVGDSVESDSEYHIKVYDSRPTIDRFFVSSKGPVLLNSFVTVHWSVSGATEVKINSKIVKKDMGEKRIKIDQPKIIKLVAKNPAGEASKTIQVKVVPKIESFSTNISKKILPGSSINLNWEIYPEAGKAYIEEKYVVENELKSKEIPIENKKLKKGSMSFNPEVKTTYTLKITGPEHLKDSIVDSKILTIDVLPLPKILKFQSSYSGVLEGGKTTISWDTRYADEVTISPAIGLVEAKGSREIGPIYETKKYTLIATNKAGEVKKSAIIAVSPKIIFFTSDKKNIGPGGSVELSWKVKGAESLILSWGSEKRELQYDKIKSKSGSIKIDNINSQTQFYLEAIGQLNGKDKKYLTVNVDKVPEISEFYCSYGDNIVRKGNSFELRWSTKNAREAYINGKEVDSLGRKNYKINETTQFTLKAVSAAGEKTSSITIKVLPEIKKFSVDKDGVFKGEEVTFEWKVDPPGESARILEDGKVISEKIDPKKGSISITPEKEGSISYKIIVEPKEYEKQIYVHVSPAPDIKYFKATPNKIFKGKESLLQWKITPKAKSAKIVNINTGETITVEPDYGILEVNPKEDTTYKLIIEPFENEKRVYIKINKRKAQKYIPIYNKNIYKKIPQKNIKYYPDKNYFASKPEVVKYGKEIILSWYLKEASRAYLTIKGKKINISLPKGSFRTIPRCRMLFSRKCCYVTYIINGYYNNRKPFLKKVRVKVIK